MFEEVGDYQKDTFPVLKSTELHVFNAGLNCKYVSNYYVINRKTAKTKVSYGWFHNSEWISNKL